MRFMPAYLSTGTMQPPISWGCPRSRWRRRQALRAVGLEGMPGSIQPDPLALCLTCCFEHYGVSGAKATSLWRIGLIGVLICDFVRSKALYNNFPWASRL